MSTTSSTGEIAPGARVGKYDVVQRIASGGMAEIYLARVSGIHGFEKHVVLKRILPQYAANQEFVRMFLKEARVAASLDHANIAHVYEIGEAGRDTFFTMEYLHGEDLRHIMRALVERGERLPLEHALEIAIGAASGLHFAHDKRGPDGRSLGIVHRDISPANVVVTYDGGVKVVDFGIAKLANDSELSQRYSLKGKLAYMSPEQLHNLTVDRRSDLFALGIVLYEMTTHVRLFKASSDVQTMKTVLAGVVPPPSSHVPDYPPALERIVLRALARMPDDRYQSARELQLDLEAFAHEERIRFSSAGLAEWMEKTFGPKLEIWHTLPPPPAQPPAPPDPTKVVARRDLKGVPSPAAAPVAVEIDVSSPASAPTAKRPPRRRWLPIVATVAVAATAGALWQARGGWGGVSHSAAAAGPIVLVAEQGRVALEQGATLTSAGSGVGAPMPMPTARPFASAEATARPHPVRAAAAARSRNEGDVGGAARGGSYSGTFARRESDIRRCFLEHSSDTTSTTEISLRFEVDRDGRASSVAVLPAAVGDSPLGACLAAVGKSTLFGKQATPLTFRIPLTVQMDTAGKSKR